MARPWVAGGLMLVLMETLAVFGAVSICASKRIQPKSFNTEDIIPLETNDFDDF